MTTCQKYVIFNGYYKVTMKGTNFIYEQIWKKNYLKNLINKENVIKFLNSIKAESHIKSKYYILFELIILSIFTIELTFHKNSKFHN